MTLYLGNTPIAGGGTVDQTYDGTSTNAQSGVAVAGAISTKADDNAVVKLTGDQTVAGVKTFNSTVITEGNWVETGTTASKGTAPASDEWRSFVVYDNSGTLTDAHALGSFQIYRATDGSVQAIMRAYENTAGSTTNNTILVRKYSNGTVNTSAPACTNNNCIVTQTARTLAEANDKWGFGNGLKIVTKEISPSSAGDTTWSYGITFSTTPVVVCCRRSGASTTTVINGWIRGDIGTSSCKFYVTAASAWELIAIGH